jgi:hypothetical protein
MAYIAAKLFGATLSALGLLLLMDSTMHAAEKELVLNTEQERIVRNSIYEGSSGIETNRQTLLDYLWVPEPLVNLYRKRPRSVVELMLRIIDGASPDVSARAAGYAFELLFGQGNGVIVVQRYAANPTTYDSVREGGSITDRQHWIRKVKERLNEKVPVK